ncbi:MAG: hypothetical protein QW690_00120 [Candidatus Anstonellales archaeon]
MVQIQKRFPDIYADDNVVLYNNSRSIVTRSTSIDLGGDALRVGKRRYKLQIQMRYGLSTRLDYAVSLKPIGQLRTISGPRHVYPRFYLLSAELPDPMSGIRLENVPGLLECIDFATNDRFISGRMGLMHELSRAFIILGFRLEHREPDLTGNTHYHILSMQEYGSEDFELYRVNRVVTGKRRKQIRKERPKRHTLGIFDVDTIHELVEASSAGELSKFKEEYRTRVLDKDRVGGIHNHINGAFLEYLDHLIKIQNMSYSDSEDRITIRSYPGLRKESNDDDKLDSIVYIRGWREALEEYMDMFKQFRRLPAIGLIVSDMRNKGILEINPYYLFIPNIQYAPYVIPNVYLLVTDLSTLKETLKRILEDLTKLQIPHEKNYGKIDRKKLIEMINNIQTNMISSEHHEIGDGEVSDVGDSGDADSDGGGGE